MNRYSYVLNNPYKYVDPNGLWAIQIAGNILGGVNTEILTTDPIFNIKGGGSLEAGVIYSGQTSKTINEQGVYASSNYGKDFQGAYLGAGGSATLNLKATSVEDINNQKDLKTIGFGYGTTKSGLLAGFGVSLSYSKESYENKKYFDPTSISLSLGPGIGLGFSSFDKSNFISRLVNMESSDGGSASGNSYLVRLPDGTWTQRKNIYDSSGRVIGGKDVPINNQDKNTGGKKNG